MGVNARVGVEVTSHFPFHEVVALRLQGSPDQCYKVGICWVQGKDSLLSRDSHRKRDLVTFSNHHEPQKP